MVRTRACPVRVREIHQERREALLVGRDRRVDGPLRGERDQGLPGQVVRRRVPDLVMACLNECRDATGAERRRNLEDLVESLEKIGAEADGRRDRFREARVSPFTVQRTYVEQRTRPDPLG